MLEPLNKYSRLNIIDVGHHKGDWIRDFSRQIPKDKFVYCVGIDPIDHKSEWNNLFIQKAVSTKTGTRKFYTYSEPGCNSLNEMLLENKFQRPQEINKVGEIEVECVTLESILDDLGLDMIHYLKVDAQGNDLDVVKSAGEWLKKCLFVQMETCVATQDDNMMYENQNTRAADISFMESQGFELVKEMDHSSVSCPEADLIFYNTRL